MSKHTNNQAFRQLIRHHGRGLYARLLIMYYELVLFSRFGIFTHKQKK